jgi:hypothetical protein
MKPKKESDDEEEENSKAKSQKSNTNKPNNNLNKNNKPFFNGTHAPNDSNSKYKRYSKNNNFNKKNQSVNGASSSLRHSHQSEPLGSSGPSLTNDPLALGTNSVQILRESNVPLIQYKNYQNSNGMNAF